MSDQINRLLGLQLPAPETREVNLPRLGLTITLQEMDYNALQACRGMEDASFHYLLKSTVAPNFRDGVWYQEHMGCPTPVEALKKLLRPGELEKLCRVADGLNGYGGGSIAFPDASEDDLESLETMKTVEYLEKN